VGEVVGLSSKQLAQRIFTGEQISIAQFSKREPIVESYVQSLDPEVSPEAVVDDAYFLGRVSLNPDAPHQGRVQPFAFGASERSRHIRVNTGDRWPLYPDGYVDMLFVDISDFDKDHYDLTYQGDQALGDKEYLRMAVQPLDGKVSGRFVGNIWVDITSFRIVRIVGTFSPKRLSPFSKYFNASGISRLGLYFHFDCWRQEVSPGAWVPASTSFDEQRMWNAGDLTTSFHLRGQTWVWSYQTLEPEARKASADPLAELKSSGLLASPGKVEDSLNRIVKEIQLANGIEGPAIDCRVLLTTPAEVFSLGNTLLISRGLLNLVPDSDAGRAHGTRNRPHCSRTLWSAEHQTVRCVR
jgi:hypothetical protein